MSAVRKGVALVATLAVGTILAMYAMVGLHIITPVYGNCVTTSEGEECMLQGYVWGNGK